MKWILQLLTSVNLPSRSSDCCGPDDVALIRRMADLLEAQESQSSDAPGRQDLAC